jgi:hypothetical protein
MGRVLYDNGNFDKDDLVLAALKKVISAKRADMLEVNLGALRIGKDYKGE